MGKERDIYLSATMYIIYNVSISAHCFLVSVCGFPYLLYVCIIITFSDGLIVFVKFMFYSSSDIGISYTPPNSNLNVVHVVTMTLKKVWTSSQFTLRILYRHACY